MSIHTKTSLKSVKKEDLVEMYLELQGKYNDVQMDEHATHKEWQKEWDALDKENEKLKSELYRPCGQYECNDNQIVIHKQKEEIEKLKRANEINDELHNTSEECIGKLEEENKKLKEENEKLNDDDWVIDCHKALKYKIVLTEDHYAELMEADDERNIYKEESEFGLYQYEKLKEENEKLKEEVKDLTKYCEISTIIADMECQYIYEYAEITDAERLCELGWADKDDFACLC